MSTLARRWRFVRSTDLIPFLSGALDFALSETAALGSACSLRLPRLQVNVKTRNQPYAELVRNRLCSDSPSLGQGSGIVVAVLSPGDSSIPEPPAWGEAVFNPRQFEKRLEETQFRASYFHDCRLWQIYDCERRFGLQWMAGSNNYPDWEPGAPLRAFLHWAYLAEDMRLAHAGTLGKGGYGVLLVGKGGSGKSGTVSGGLVGGLQSVGDDYVLIERLGNQFNVYPLFRKLKQDRQGLDRLGLGADIVGTRASNWQGKFEFDSEEISGQSLAANLNLRAIVIPKISGTTRSAFSAIPKHRAMLALAPTGLFQLPGERDSGVKFFADLVRNLPCFELALSVDPVDITQALEAFIDRGCRCD